MHSAPARSLHGPNAGPGLLDTAFALSTVRRLMLRLQPRHPHGQQCRVQHALHARTRAPERNNTHQGESWAGGQQCWEADACCGCLLCQGLLGGLALDGTCCCGCAQWGSEAAAAATTIGENRGRAPAFARTRRCCSAGLWGLRCARQAGNGLLMHQASRSAAPRPRCCSPLTARDGICFWAPADSGTPGAGASAGPQIERIRGPCGHSELTSGHRHTGGASEHHRAFACVGGEGVWGRA